MIRYLDEGSLTLPMPPSPLERKLSRSEVKSSTVPGIGGCVTAVS